MGHLLFILVTLLLLVGFFLLTWYEERQGSRLLFASARAGLDERVARVMYILTHVDLPAFIRDEIRRTISRLGHLAAILSLSFVRAVERLLTRLVRYMRTKHPVDTEPAADTRPFLKTLSAFKGRLKSKKRSDIPPIE